MTAVQDLLGSKRGGCSSSSDLAACPVGLRCGRKRQQGSQSSIPTACHLNPQLSSVQSLSRVLLFATPWTVARQASLSITNSQSLPRLMSIESVMPSSHLNPECPPQRIITPSTHWVHWCEWIRGPHPVKRTETLLASGKDSTAMLLPKMPWGAAQPPPILHLLLQEAGSELEQWAELHCPNRLHLENTNSKTN